LVVIPTRAEASDGFVNEKSATGNPTSNFINVMPVSPGMTGQH
jgi:hypothetical protein